MKRVAAGVVDFVVGDDIGIVIAVMVLLALTAGLVRLGWEARWVLPAGVPAALWVSLLRSPRSRPAG